MFHPRKTEMTGIRKIAGRQFKVYTIVADGKQVQPETVEAAKDGDIIELAGIKMEFSLM